MLASVLPGALRRLVPLSCVCSLLLGGCSSTPSGASASRASASAPVLELRPWHPPEGQSCRVIGSDSLPSFTAAFDSAALATSARRLGTAGSMLVTVHTDSLGFPREVRRIETTLPEAEAELLEDSVRVYFRGGRPIGARVRVDVRPGQEPRFTVGRRQECPPELRNRRQVQTYLEDANRVADRSGTVKLWVFILEDGTVANVRVVEESGNEYLDAVSIGIATRMQFHPALTERRPVPVWVQIPFSLRLSNFAAPPVR